MSHLQEIMAMFEKCNLHFCAYGAFGLTFILRATIFRHGPEEAREHFAHGIVYLLLGLLK